MLSSLRALTQSATATFFHRAQGADLTLGAVGSLIREHPTRGSTNALDSGDIGRGSLGAPSDQRRPDRCSQGLVSTLGLIRETKRRSLVRDPTSLGTQEVA